MSGRNAQIGAGIAVLALALGIGIFFWNRPPQLDAPILEAFRKASGVSTYVQQVETVVRFNDRTMTVIGTYYNDASRNRYASHSTTTLTIPDQPAENREHVFTLQNIAIADDVYTKLETTSALLRKTSSVPYSSEWRHFKASAIPEDFRNVAVPGPILDNVRLLSEDGAYMTLTAKHGKVVKDGYELLRYTFKPSGTLPDKEGALKALLERIGPFGTVDVWIDDVTFDVRFMTLENEEYRSEGALSGFGTPLNIDAPLPR